MPNLPARLFISLVGSIGIAGAAMAQTQAPGAIVGRITDPSGLAMTDVVVTATRAPDAREFTTRSDASGMYAFRSLPTGEYRLAFDFTGFQHQEHTVSVAVAAGVTLDVRLEVAPIPQFIKVTPRQEDEPPPETPPGKTTFQADALDRVPVGRTPEQAVLLAPGVTANGPNGALTMAGAFSYGNLFLVDGLAASENTRGLSRPFFIPDAVQETRVATAAVPAEYGRFQGGVVNTITRSGGNRVSGSARLSIRNDGWRALTPFRGDATLNHRVPAWEVVLGGPLIRQKLYYLGAAMGARTEQTRTLPYTRVNYLYADTERKYQLKATWTPSKSHTVKASYFRVDSSRTNANSGAVMDRTSLYDNESPESLMGVTHTAILGPRLLLETRYSRRRLTYTGSGSHDTSLPGGTPIWDRSRSDARFNSAAGCAVCEGASDARNNQDLTAKLWFNPAGRRRHEMTAGVDFFQETRRTNSYQSGSGFRVRATRSIVQGDRVFPVFLPDRTTWIYWQPILQPAAGNDLRTYSAFASDTWRMSSKLTVKAGVRFDLNDDRDSMASPAVHDASWSPRLGVTWDPTGRGKWTVNAGWSRYVASINTNIADAASPGGRPATYVYDYLGPAVNGAGVTSPMSSHDALDALFGWFLAGAGVKRPTRSAPSIPGVNVRIAPDLQPLDTREMMAGFTRQLGRRGFVKMEGLYRRFLDFYATRRDTTTGKVVDPAGTKLDVMLVTNAPPGIERSYKALLTQLTYRPAVRLQVSAAYTLSSTFGNVDGEDANVGPSMVTISDYPEYRDARWSAPLGPMGTDQRHRLRLWGTCDLKTRPSIGRITIGLVQRVESGAAWSAVGNVNPKAYVVNRGYIAPPASVPYYFSARGAFRTGVLTATDLSASWSRRLRAAGKGEFFFRGMLANVFNEAAAVRVNRTVLTRNDSIVYQAFNPFTDRPVEGVHYGFGNDFGKPIGPSDYQPPRDFSISFGIRY